LRFADLLSHVDNDLEKTSKENELLDKELSALKDLKAEIGNSLEMTSRKLENADRKLNDYSLSNLEMKKEISQKDKKLEHLKNEFLQSITDNNEEMKNAINDLLHIISKKEDAISVIKQEMVQSIKDKDREIVEAINELMEKLLDQDDIITKLENDLEIKTIQLENAETSFELAFTEKDKIIKKLKTRLGSKIKKIDELEKQVDELEEKVLEGHVSEKILEEIRNLMLTKGFINDKEFDKLTKEYKKQNFMIFY